MEEVIVAIEYELSGSGNFVGYRQMHQRLRNDYGIIVDRETSGVDAFVDNQQNLVWCNF